MSIIKEKIKYDGNDMKIQISLDSNNNFTGFQEEINEFTKLQTDSSINEANDGEVKKFKLKTSAQTKTMNFRFYLSGDTWNPWFTTAGFTEDDINLKRQNFLNSFFILDFFDTYNPLTQTKIFSSYLTKLFLNNKDDIVNYSIFNLLPTTQLFNLYIPLNNITFDNNIFYGYTRFSFYNAKTGKISVFFNQDNQNLNTAERMYFKTKLNLDDKTWDFITPTMQNDEPFEIIAKELHNSTEYIERYNDTFNNFDNLQQNYPIGNVFNYETGNYETIEE